MKKLRRNRRFTGVDVVAIILAIGVSLLACLIIIGTIIQILHNAPGLPEIQLSENATQILIAAIGGIVGVLGGYVGYQMHRIDSTEKHMTEEQHPATPPGQGAPPPASQPASPAPEPETDPVEEDRRREGAELFDPEEKHDD